MKKTGIIILFAFAIFCSACAYDTEQIRALEDRMPRCLRDFGLTVYSSDVDMAKILERARLAIYSTGFETPKKDDLFAAFERSLNTYKKFKKEHEELEWVVLDAPAGSDTEEE